jgi:hypothetical protein
LVYLIHFDYLKSTFNIDSFDQLNSAIDQLPPSLLEYHIESLLSYADEALSFNRNSIEHSVYIEKYQIYFDYEQQCFLEKNARYDEYETGSLF